MNHLQFSAPKNWFEVGKGVQHPFEDKRLISQITAINRVIKQRRQLDKNYKDERKKQLIMIQLQTQMKKV